MRPTIIYEATDKGVVVYVDGCPKIVAVKVGEVVELAKNALNGVLKFPEPDIPDVTDHGWLLRFASACAATAAKMV